jgi:hypothetical protein
VIQARKIRDPNLRQSNRIRDPSTTQSTENVKNAYPPRLLPRVASTPPAQGLPQRESDEIFGEVVDSYTDAEALEDGVLVELYMPARFQEFPINRMTRHLFDDLAPFVEAEASLLNGESEPRRQSCRKYP